MTGITREAVLFDGMLDPVVGHALSESGYTEGDVRAAGRSWYLLEIRKRSSDRLDRLIPL